MIKIKLGKMMTMVVDYSFGEIEVREGTMELVPEKETEKAVFLQFVGSMYDIDEDTGEVIEEWEDQCARFSTYLPKSQIKINDHSIDVPEWLVRKDFKRFAYDPHWRIMK